MIPEIKEINFPSYATLCKATASYVDMGEKTITSQVAIDGQIAPDFSFDWEVQHMGEKFIMPLRTPQASKENTSLSSKIDLTFQHWAIYQLKRWYFFTLQSYEAGVAVADKYIASVSLNLKNFCDLYSQLLKHYYGDTIKIDLNPSWKASDEPIYIDINYSYMWDVLIKLYDLFAVRWEIVPDEDPDHYVIKVGYPVEEMDHIFEYGFEGGLLKVERQVQDDNIRNMLLGRGGDKNIPYRYFKDVDPNNPTFQADPDWVPELANVYIDRLRSAEFRSYIQGWKAKHYGGTVTRSQTYVPWAYDKGYSDTKFDPIEYVKDDESIRKYGELMGGLENNDEIYPSIQGVVIDPLGRIDQVIDVEKVDNDKGSLGDDDSDSESKPDVETIDLGKIRGGVISIPAHTVRKVELNLGLFDVPKDKYGNINIGTNDIIVYGNGASDYRPMLQWYKDTYAVAVSNGTEIAGSGIPEGSYMARLKMEVENTSDVTLTICVTSENSYITIGDGAEDKPSNTFDIWIKNIWQTTKNADESDEEYAERVWKPILGNHLGDEAAVCFSSGLLSTSEDYTFLILGKAIKNSIHYDTSKSLNGVQSHWRLTLVRSDADYNSLGKLVPNLERQGKAGDYFYFTGIELTLYYVKWAEQRLHDYKLDQLEKVKDIQPSWVVSLDKVRIGTPHYDETASILSQLHIGGSVRIADKRFIGGSQQLYLYLQQITYKYNESQNKANLTPDVEVVLGTEYTTAANPVATIQSQIDAIQNQMGGYSFSNVQQIVRMVGDRIYLRKDGITDRSQSPTYFANLLAALGFRQGIVGGRGWGFFQDENGKWTLETDRINVRDEMQVNSLVINQIKARGGMTIESTASIEVTDVEDNQENDYVKCYFDIEGGLLGNLFRVDDIAYCHRFTPENNSLKLYKRRIVGIGEDYILLTKGYAPVNIGDEENPLYDTGVYGSGIPEEGDVIVQYGNYTDKERQYVIIRDVISGGYERMLSGLDSVLAEGTEYFYAGYQSSTGERLFIGTRENDQYIEYKDRKLYIPGQLILGSIVEGEETMLDFIKKQIGTKTYNEQPTPPYNEGDIWTNAVYPEDGSIYNGEILRCLQSKGKDEEFDIEDWELADGYTAHINTYKYLKEALERGRTEIEHGLVLSSLIQLGKWDKEKLTVYSGLSGLYDEEAYGKGIASWYGGDMLDGELEKWVNKETTRYAQSLFRHDGTGYLAGGNIGWNLDGSGWMAGHNIEWDKDGLMSFGTGIKIGGTTLGGLETSISSIQTFIAALSTILVPVNERGDVLLAEDNKTVNWNHRDLYAARIKGYGFYADGFVSVYGLNDGVSTGGSSTLAGLSDVSLSLPLSNGQALVYRNGSWRNETINTGNGGLNEGQLAEYLSSHIYTATFAEGKFSAKTYNPVQGAATINIPTSTSHLTNDSNFITSSILDNYVKKSGDTMTGQLEITARNALKLTASNSYLWNTGTAFCIYFGEEAPVNTIDSGVMMRFRPTSGTIDCGFNSYTLGDTTCRWGGVYSVIGNFSTSITIGRATISWDEDSQGLKINTGLYSEQWISIKGINNDASGGGISEDFLKNYLTNNNYAKKSDIPSLNGYATETWVQNQLANIKLTDYLSLSGGTMRNTNLVTNMNADLLDGIHISGIPHYDKWIANPGWDADERGNYIRFTYTTSGAPATGTVLSVQARDYGFQLLTRYSSDGSLYYRRFGSDTDGGLGTWQQLARITDNVASATRLQGSYTLWGQTFYGNNVSGSLTSVTDITMSGNLYINSSDSNNGIYFSRAGNNYIRSTASNGNVCFLTGGKTQSDTPDLVIEKGYVMPGATNSVQLGASSYRWSNINSVLGNFSGAVTMTSTLNVSGLITAQSGIKIGDGTITWDSSAGGFRFSHGLYSEQWVSIRGINNGVGGGVVSGDYLPLSGGTLTGPLNFNITTAAAQITFARSSYNYIRCTSTGGALAFVPNGLSNNLVNASLVIDSQGIFPGATNTYSLGLSSYRWTTLYAQTLNVTSTNLVSNLNADMLDGYHATDFVSSSVLSGYVTGSQLASAISTLASQSWVNTQLDSYLPLTGGTLTGTVTTTSSHIPFNFNYTTGNYNYIQCANSLAFIAAGKGAAIANATLVIRTDGITPGNGTYNCGSTTYRWNAIYGVSGNFSGNVTASNITSLENRVQSLENNSGSTSGDFLPLTGGTLTGALKFNISTASAQLSFSRASLNYIHANTSGGSLAFVVNGLGITQANSSLIISSLGVYPGASSTINLGITNFRWNAIYGVTGNFSSAVSQNTSDLRLKTDISADIDCLSVLLKLGNVFTYRYNGLAVSKRRWLDTTTLHTGIAYQNAIRAMIPDFTGMDEQGYGYVNFLSSDYQATILGALIQTAMLQKAMENDVNWLKERVRQLEKKVAELESA